MPEMASGHSEAALSALRQRLHAGIQEMQVEAVGLTPPLNEAFSRIRNATKMVAGDKVGAARHDQIMQAVEALEEECRGRLVGQQSAHLQILRAAVELDGEGEANAEERKRKKVQEFEQLIQQQPRAFDWSLAQSDDTDLRYRQVF